MTNNPTPPSANIELAHLPDLSAWRMAPLLTLEQAALLWAGIDPSVHSDINKLNQVSHIQRQRAKIALQAFLGGVVLKTLTVYELWVFSDDINNYTCKVDSQYSPSIEEINCRRTLVMRDVLIAWAAKEGVHTLRQTLNIQKAQQEEAKRKQDFEDFIRETNTPAVIEYKPLEPKYDTPEFEAACLVVAQYWNGFDGEGKPPKEIEIKEFIRNTLIEKLGGEPSQAAINRIDTLTRPNQFKTQQKTKK